MKNIILALFLIISKGCVTTDSKINLNIYDLEKINIGMQDAQVLQILSKPNSFFNTQKNSTDEFWIYNDEQSNQIGMLAINKDSRKVVSITILPQADSLEFNSKYLFEKKFSGLNFLKYEKKCSAHLPTTSADYVNKTNGLVITVDEHFKYVKNYNYFNQENLKVYIENIQNCR